MTDLTQYDCVLFDLDGVLTPTADVHMQAWSEMFSEYFSEHQIEPGYSDADYFAYVDGKPRFEGVASLLASRGINLPKGEPDDPSSVRTVCGLGNRKNELFSTVLARDGVKAYQGSIRLLDVLELAGTPIAVVSSSRNAEAVLEASGLRARFTVVVDGMTASRHSIPGKPLPDTYLYAASLLGADPHRSVVVEDAVSGVQAGVAGGFGLVVGVDRGAGEAVLKGAGADLVVRDLQELTMASPAER